MIYINSIKINNWKHFNFEKPIFLKPGINLILGKNGSGKTSLLEMIQSGASNKPQSLSTELQSSYNEGQKLVAIETKEENQENDIEIINKKQGSEGVWDQNELQSSIRFITSSRSVNSGGTITNPFATSLNIDSNLNIGETIDVAEEFNKAIIKELIDIIKQKISKGTNFLKAVQDDYQKELVDFDKSLKIDPTKSNAVYFIDYKEREVPIKDLSLGEKEYLYFYSYFRRIKSDENKIILIDEPELHLHSSQIRKLCELIRDISIKNQVIIATHSGEILQYFISQANMVLLSKGNVDNIDDTEQMQKILEETGLPIDPSVFTAHWICAENDPSLAIKKGGPTTPEVLMWLFGKDLSKRYWSFGSNREIAKSYISGIGTVFTSSRNIKITPILDGDKRIKSPNEYFPSDISVTNELSYFPFWELENIFLMPNLLNKVIDGSSKLEGSNRFWELVKKDKSKLLNQIKKTIAKNYLRKFSLDKYIKLDTQNNIEFWKKEIEKADIDLSSIDSKFDKIIKDKNWRWLPGKESLGLAISLDSDFWKKIILLQQSNELKEILKSESDIKKFIEKIIEIDS